MLFLLALLLLAPQAERAEAERLFALGNRLADEGDPGGAAAAYEGALGTGWTSPELELNLGSAYLRAGQLGRAVLHVERAQRLAPREPAVQHNLRLVRERVGRAEAPPSPAEAAARWLSVRLGAGEVTAGLLVLYLAALGLVALRLGTRAARPWLRRALVVLVPLTALVAVAAVLTARTEAAPSAVALAGVDVRSAPSGTAPVTEHLPEGAVLAVTERRGLERHSLWRAVRLSDGTVGWAEAAALEEI